MKKVAFFGLRSWTTWNQPTVIAAFAKIAARADLGRRRYIGDNVDDPDRLAAMAEQQLTKRARTGRALAWRHEKDWLIHAIHVDENDDVVGTMLAGGLVQPERATAA